MAKNKIKKRLGDSLNPRFLEELKRQTLIKSTASSLRLSGVNITNEKVKKIIKAFTPKSAKHEN